LGPGVKEDDGNYQRELAHEGGLMTRPEDIARYRINLQGEIDGAMLYRTMAEVTTQPQLAEIYRRLATVEEAHAGLWERQLRQAGQPVPPRRPSWRARTLRWLAKRLGAAWVLPTLATMEHVDQHVPMLASCGLSPECRLWEWRGERSLGSRAGIGPLGGMPSERRCWGRTMGWCPI
jgi:hypothetical protein